MLKTEKSYVSLDDLAFNLNLSKKYLSKLADDKTIPFLDVRGKRRFNIAAVQAVLNVLASQSTGTPQGKPAPVKPILGGNNG